MKRILKQTLALTSLLLLSGAAAAQVTNTPHNLSSSGTFTNNAGTNTDQICVFCHTPHGADSSAGSPPLWNKNIPDMSTYATYESKNSSTIDGAMTSTGSVSVACLSCHDGTQAMDNMFNAPGRGWGEGDGSAGVTQGWTFNGSNVVTGAARIAGGGDDLANDHPIGIEYCGGGLSANADKVTVDGTCGDLDFERAAVRTKDVNGNQVFWVDVGTAAGSRDKADIILYTRDFSANGGGAASPSVECASCHDPHVESKNTDGTDTEVHFMRVTTAGSAICLACHVK